MFQSPACLSLAIRRAPRLGASGLKSLDLADGELVGGHLAAGGVVDDVLADLDRPDHRRVGRAVLGSGSSSRTGRRASRSPRCGSRARCPRAGGSRGQAGAWPARPDARAEAGGAGTRARGRSPPSAAEARSNSGCRNRRRRRGSPPARRTRGCSACAAAENSGALWPLKNTIGAWSRSCDGRDRGVDDLPGQAGSSSRGRRRRRGCGCRRGRCSSRRPGRGGAC